MARVTLNKINAAIQDKYPGAILVRGNGYFYVTSDDPVMQRRTGSLYQTGIYVAHLGELPLERWVEQIDALFNNPKN